MTDALRDSNTTIGELINRAFQLAYFIHDDRASAMHIAISAYRKLKVASTAQRRRVYYTPTGQLGYRAVRTRVSLSDLHILQRLVYIESEIYEKIAEEGREALLGQVDMIIRFIKHLVKITLNRNSFYVSLGLSRVLYNYTTAEAIEIYSAVIQDPERARENYYYRSQKAALMRELRDRFGDLLRVHKAKHGEERFASQHDPATYLELVRTCLRRFMPWGTACVLPADFDPIKRVVPPLLFKGDHPDEEHAIELNRLHTLLHPDCFRRLALALSLDPPERRLEVPYFFLSSDDPKSNGRRLDTPSLSDEELEVISDRINKEAARRKNGAGRLLAVLVDGVECGRLDLNRARALRIGIGAGAELIEVRSLGSLEDTLLAVYLVPQASPCGISSKAEVILEGGQALSFELSNVEPTASEPGGAVIRVEYRETRPLRAMALRLRQTTFSLLAALTPGRWGRGFASGYARILVFLMAGLAALLLYVRVQQHRPDQPGAPQQAPAAPTAGNPPATETMPQETPKTESKPGESARTESQTKGPQGGRATSNTNAVDERTRAPKQKTTPVTLLSISRIYISAPDDEPLSRQLGGLLAERLRSMNRFLIVATPEEADAMLDIAAIQPLAGGKVSVALRLVGAQGQVLWSAGRARYSGDPTEVADRMLKDLKRDLQAAGKER